MLKFLEILIISLLVNAELFELVIMMVVDRSTRIRLRMKNSSVMIKASGYCARDRGLKLDRIRTYCSDSVSFQTLTLIKIYFFNFALFNHPIRQEL